MWTKKKSNGSPKRIYQLHRFFGVVVGVPLLVVAITGFLLNHAEDFHLDSVAITQPAVLSWYKMTPSSQPVAILAENHWITLFEGLIYFDEKPIAPETAVPVGLALLDQEMAIATKHSILLVDRKTLGLIEKVSIELLPPGEIRAFALQEKQEARSEKVFRLDTTEGKFSLSLDVSGFMPVETPALPVIESKIPPEELYQSILNEWRGRGVSLSRIVYDIHSGSIFGASGWIISDLVAFSVVWLIVSGLYTWSKTSR